MSPFLSFVLDLPMALCLFEHAVWDLMLSLLHGVCALGRLHIMQPSRVANAFSSLFALSSSTLPLLVGYFCQTGFFFLSEGCRLTHKHTEPLTRPPIGFCTLLWIWQSEWLLFIQRWTWNRPKDFGVSNWGQVSPKNNRRIVYNSEMAVTCQKRSCSLQSKPIFYMSGLFRLGCRLCGFPSILWFAVMGTLWFCEYSVHRLWGMTCRPQSHFEGNWSLVQRF